MSQQEFKNSPEYKLWIKETDGHISEKNRYRGMFLQRIKQQNEKQEKDVKR